MVTTSLIIPPLYRLLHRKLAGAVFETDIFIAQASLAVMAMSDFGIVVANRSAFLMAFVSFGTLTSGYEFSMRSLLSQGADEANISVVCTTMSMP